MVEIAQEAFRLKNFRLASEIYERVIQEKGPAASLFIALGNCLALDGQISRAFTAFLKAYRLAKIESKDIKTLVHSLVRLMRDRMKQIGDSGPGLLLNKENVLENEPFVCVVCIGTINQPTTIYCGHTYCSKCVAKQGINVCVKCGSNPQIAVEFRTNVVLMEVMTKLFPHMDEIRRLKSYANEKFIEENYGEAVQCYSQIITRSK